MVGNFDMTTTYTKVQKVTGTAYTKQSMAGGLNYDEATDTYDSAADSYDGNSGTYTKISKPTTTYTKIVKPT